MMAGWLTTSAFNMDSELCLGYDVLVIRTTADDMLTDMVGIKTGCLDGPAC